MGNDGHIVFVVNPIAGDGRRRKLIDEISSRMRSCGIFFSVAMTQYAGHAKDLALEAAESGARMVVAVGGDGTVNEVASSLVGSETALGIIPCGSGNGLAYHLGIKKWLDALDNIVSGKIEQIDTATVNGHPFFCTAGVGYDALVASDYSRSGSRGLLTYADCALKDWRHYVPERYRIETDSGVMESEAFLITVGNANQWGNNYHITPEASLDDGFLDVTLIKPFNVVESIGLLSRIRGYSLNSSDKVVSMKTKSVKIIRQKAGVAHYDGEVVSLGEIIDIKVNPASLWVCVQ